MVSGDVAHDDGFVAIGGGAAGTDVGSDGETVHLLYKFDRQAAAGAFAQTAARIQQEDGAIAAGNHAFNAGSKGVENFFEVRAFGD